MRGFRLVLRDPEGSHYKMWRWRTFPVTVINDTHGGDLYEEGKARYQVKAP